MEFSEVNTAFKNLGIVHEIAECHGLLCGLWSASGGVGLEEWLRLMRSEDLGAGAPPAPSPPARPSASEAVLQRLYKETVTQLEDPEFGLRLLLPDDEQPLAMRTEALADWCKGFLFGLGVGGVENYRQTPPAVQEIIKDFTEITRAYHEDEGDDEVDESSFMEVMEYVRVGAMLVYEELQAERQEGRADGDRVLH